MALNLNNLKTPGVYIDEVSLLPPSIVPVATAIPAFIGCTEKGFPGAGESAKAVRITSFAEYKDLFGGPPSPANLASGNITIAIKDIVKDISVSGTVTGSTLVSRTIEKVNQAVMPASNMYFAVKHFYDNGGGVCYIVSVAAYRSYSDAEIKKGIDVLEQEDEVTLFVIPEAPLDTSNYDSIYAKALDQCQKLKDRFVILDIPQSATAPTNRAAAIQDVSNFQTNSNIGDYGLYGAAYYPFLETNLDIEFTGFESEIKITHTRKLENGSDSEDPATLYSDLSQVTEDLLKKQIGTEIRSISIILPPGAALAGIYTRVDNDRGVWKAPANVSVSQTIRPMVKITDDMQENMNIDPNGGKSVNAIRTFTGRGILVWGARTLFGNDNEWRYVPVRRFFNFVEESVKKATYRFVFEPNDSNTWNTIRAMIENFLTIQWNMGALMGAKPDDAFYVKVGLGTTMTAQDVLEGRLIVEIGMAAVRPAEFIILRFMHKLPTA